MDTEHVFTAAVLSGREIEFHYGGLHYFESRTSPLEWYIYCQETKSRQSFPSAQKLIETAALQGRFLREIWDELVIDYIF